MHLNVIRRIKESTERSRNPIPGHIVHENQNLERHMYPNVHCSIIYNNQVWKQPKCPSTEE